MFFRHSYSYLCPNIINFDSVDFSERRPEEVMFLLTLSVYIHNIYIICVYMHTYTYTTLYGTLAGHLIMRFIPS